MLVKDIINLACQFLDKAEFANKLKLSEELSQEEGQQLNELVQCFNLVREELYTEILPIVKIDRLKTQNLKVPFVDFSFMPVSILAVKDGSGRHVRHKVNNDGVVAFANEVEIWYTIKPDTLAIDDEFSSTIPERIYAYGLVREFYIRKALYNDAEIWEDRYKNSIDMLTSKKSAFIPRRRWL